MTATFRVSCGKLHHHHNPCSFAITAGASMMASMQECKSDDRITALQGRGNGAACNIFENCAFVLTRKAAYADELSALIATCGGKVLKTIPKSSKRRVFFVVSWLEDDDGRLGVASDRGACVVSPGYVRACADSGNLLDFTAWSAGDMLSNIFKEKSMQMIFLKPCPDEAREREEQPQPFSEYLSFLETDWFTPQHSERKKIYTIALESQTASKPRCASTTLNEMIVRDFFSAFFGLEVIALPPLRLYTGGVKGVDTRPLIDVAKTESKKRKRKQLQTLHSRKNKEDGHIEIEVIDFIAAMKPFLPKDGYALVAITQEDLFEENIPGANQQVLGRAAGQDLVCAISTHSLSKSKGKRTMLLRERLNLLNTAAHEVLHIFALDHCGYYLCTMSAHFAEDYIYPVEVDRPDGKVATFTSAALCPICVQKLQRAIGFNVRGRYKRLQEFYDKGGWNAQAAWISRALAALRD